MVVNKMRLVAAILSRIFGWNTLVLYLLISAGGLHGEHSEILEENRRLIDGLDALAVEVTLSFEPPDHPLGYSGNWSLQMKKPNFLKLSVTRGEIELKSRSGHNHHVILHDETSIISDGNRCYLVVEDEYYRSIAAPRNPWQIFDREVHSRSQDLRDMVFGFYILDLIVPGHLSKFMEDYDVQLDRRERGSKEGFYEFELTTSNSETRRILTMSADSLLVTRYTVVYREDMIAIYEFNNWQLNPSFPEDHFLFIPSPNIKEVDSLRK